MHCLVDGRQVQMTDVEVTESADADAIELVVGTKVDRSADADRAEAGPVVRSEVMQGVAPVDPALFDDAPVARGVAADVAEVDRPGKVDSALRHAGPVRPIVCSANRSCGTTMNMPLASAQSRSPTWSVPTV